MVDYIKPECMPYYYLSDGTMQKNESQNQTIAYTADGYLLPCCWCDAESTRSDIIDAGLYNPYLKLSANNSVDTILHSEEWKKFIYTIMHTPQNAPRCCKEKCGEKNE
jgi:hypothetical protein